MEYNAGWLIQGKVLALTHFETVVSPQIFMEIATITNTLVNEVTGPFHLLIDDRIIADTSLVSLDNILQVMPILNHPLLLTIVIILPVTLEGTAEDIPEQKNGNMVLKYVDNLDSAYRHLQAQDPTINWEEADSQFFVHTK
ncbi:hypothetical protein I6N90_00250 [Paenibacillus sp. GSMTC-2017]|uniref:hypothetical protein n=1 Tax=Paenibacillus sp. GSMTC-2017 TaxID=2794350 RepID=UPI0018D8FC9F|nr:hypothetical protein [Paenibacillus sp. GSMTC-2017]MBH5316238.1 hypothetical protein [Paenibacillus sp. GSMTC-2017]